MQGEPLMLRGSGQTGVTATFSADGAHVLSVSWDGIARVWNADGSGEPRVLPGAEEQVNSAAFSPDGSRLVTASMDLEATARIRSLAGSGEPVPIQGHEGWLTSIAFSPDGSRFVAGSWDGTVRIWSADGTGQPLVLDGQDEMPIMSMAFSPDGARIMTAAPTTRSASGTAMAAVSPSCSAAVSRAS